MMENNRGLFRRIIAIVLTLCITLSSETVYVPGWFTSFAETENEAVTAVPADSGAEIALEGAGNSKMPAASGQEAPAAPAQAVQGTESAAPAVSGDAVNAETPAETTQGTESTVPAASGGAVNAETPAETTQGTESTVPAAAGETVQSEASVEAAPGTEAAAPAEVSQAAQSDAPAEAAAGTETAPAEAAAPTEADGAAQPEAPAEAAPGTETAVPAESGEAVSAETPAQPAQETAAEAPAQPAQGTGVTEVTAELVRETAAEAPAQGTGIVEGAAEPVRESAGEASAQPARRTGIVEIEAEPAGETAAEAPAQTAQGAGIVEIEAEPVQEATAEMPAESVPGTGILEVAEEAAGETVVEAPAQAENLPGVDLKTSINMAPASQAVMLVAEEPSVAVAAEAAVEEAAEAGEIVPKEDTKAGESAAEEEGEEALLPEEAGDETDTVQPALAVGTLGAGSGTTPEGLSILQQKILDAMTGKLSGTVQVILESNTVYEANKTTDEKWNNKILISAEDYDIQDDFELELVAKDAGEEGMDGEGFTTLNANLVIQGVKVVMKSVSMAAGKSITVTNGKAEKAGGGKLTFYGTNKRANELTVDVGAKSSAEIYTGDNDDIIHAVAKSGAESLQIDAGDGLNQVDVQAGGGKVTVGTGGDNDNVTVNITGTNQGLEVGTGAGSDTVKVIDNGRAAEGKEMVVHTGTGDDQVTMDVRADGGNLTLNTGKGSDTVNVMKGDIFTKETLDYDANDNGFEKVKSGNGTGATITIVNGDEEARDRVSVDANTGLAVDELHFQGGSGASVYLHGTLTEHLPKGVDPLGFVDGDPSKGVELHAEGALDKSGTAENADLKLKITYENADLINLTDALKNKKRVEVFLTGKGTFVLENGVEGELQNFTDYVVKTAVSKDIEKIQSNTGKALTLTNLVLDERFIGEAEPYIPAIDAQNLNVLLKAPTISINKDITARNLRAESSMGSYTVLGAFGDMGEGASLKDSIANLFEAEDTAQINVNAAIKTAQDVVLLARVKHFGGLVAFLPESLNLVDVKDATAKVNIGEKARLNAGGSVTAEAKIHTTIGEKKETDRDGGPVGVDIILNDASVNVAKDARITADRDILLAASSDVRDYNYAKYGAWGSPVALAVSVIINDVDVKVNGNLDAGRQVKLDASGTVTNDAESVHVNGKEQGIGGYVAVSVVNQSADAVIGEGAVVIARKGDVVVHSNAVANVNAIATSGSSEKIGGPDDALSTALGPFLKPILEKTVLKLWSKIKYSVVDEKIEKFLDTIDKIQESDKTVKVVNLDEESAKGGSATAKIKIGPVNDEKGHRDTFGLIETTPKVGYKVDSVKIRYLKPGEDHYTYEELSETGVNQYLFWMLSSEVEAFVNFVKEGDKKSEKLKDAEIKLIENDDVDEKELKDTYGINMMLSDFLDDMDDEDDDDFDFLLGDKINRGGTYIKREDGSLIHIEDEIGDIGELYDDDDDDEEEGHGEDEPHAHTLIIHNDNPNLIEHGKILTWKVGNDGKSLKKVYDGEKIRLVPNPDEGMELTSLTVYYTHTVDGREVEEEIPVTADEQGRYIFTVPDDIQEKHVSMNVKATFGEASGGVKKPVHEQVSGAIAVGVTLNESVSRIDSGSVVNAAGLVDMLGNKHTNTNILADGTQVKEGAKEKIEAEYAKLQPVQKIRYNVAGAQVSLKAGGSLEGKVTSDIKLEDGASATTPKITFQLDDAVDQSRIASVEAFVTYFTKLNGSLDNSKGTRTSATIKDLQLKDGKVELQLNSSKYMSVEGSPLEVTFLFKDKDGNVLTRSDGTTPASTYIVPNAIRTSVNQLMEINTDPRNAKSLGELNFVRMEVGEDGVIRYYFRINEHATNALPGYKCDPVTGSTREGDAAHEVIKSNKDVLFATWEGADGRTEKVSLARDDKSQYWYLKSVDGNTSIPEGAIITVNAVFSEDLRDVTVRYLDEDGSKYGTAKLSQEAVKQGDKLIVTLNPKDGWTAVGVSGIVRTGTINTTKRLDDANIVYKGNNQWEITAPEFKDGEKLFINPLFNAKTIEIKQPGEVKVRISETDGKAANGQTITIQPTSADLKSGKKLDLANTKVTYQGETLEVNSKGEFTIPKGEEYTATELTIEAALKEKDYEITPFTSEDGDKIEAASGKADMGDLVTLNIIPRKGYRAKGGTVQAVIATKNASGNISKKRVIADWVRENTYQFRLSAEGTVDSVKLTGEFEEGSDGVAFSMGVAVGVGVVQGRNRVEIAGEKELPVLDEKGDKVKVNGTVQTRTVAPAKVTFGGGLKMEGLSLGGQAATEAKAGFNAGDTGVAGALVVQVAKTLTDVAVRKDAQLTMTGQGAIELSARTRQDFKTTGDASGREGANQGGSVGVGAGLAVAVDSLETNSILEDGAVLNGANYLTGLSLNAETKYRDQMTARAGAQGGTAAVPVAAVDVFNSRVRAELGRLAGLQNGVLPLQNQARIRADGESALAQANHEIIADASSRGDGAAIGAALIVTWLKNDVQALLRQSLNAGGDVSLSSRAAEALKAIAKASAVGGADKGTDANGEGGADQQANKVLKGAGGMAGKYGDMNGGEIMNDADDRQKAETAEEKVTGAGSFVLNMQQNKSRAEITDGTDVTAGGKLTVKSANRTDATIRADASATHSDIGVGIGVAINIVTMENIARIGNGKISAQELELTADIAKAPSQVRNKMLAFSNIDAFTEELKAQIASALKEAMGEKTYNKMGWASDAFSLFVAKAADTLIKELNMTDLFNKMGSTPADTFADVGKLLLERLKALPQALVSPFMEIWHEAYDMGVGLSKGTMKTILETALNQVIVQTPGNLVDVAKAFVTNSAKNVGAAVLEMLTDKMTGKGVSGTKIKEAFQAGAVTALWDLLDKTIEQTVRNIGAQFPIVNDSNVAYGKSIVALVKKMKENAAEVVKDTIVPYLTDTFREEIWDYAPVVEKIQQDGFVNTLKSTLIKVLKESTAALTNEAIDQITGKLDVKLQRESTENRHIIVTQAIAGSGAKKKSGTGSLAIAVANLTTKAEIAGGDGAVSVQGNMTVDAQEERMVRTNSTAAVDERGEPDNHDGAGNSDDANTGGGEEASKDFFGGEGNRLSITSDAGIESVTFEDSLDDNSVMIKALDGYIIEPGNCQRVYTRPDGSEVMEPFKLVADQGFYYSILDPTEGIKGLTEEELNELNIQFQIQTTRQLREIPKVKATDISYGDHHNSGVNYDKEITVGVEGQENDEFGRTWAGLNDLGEINIPVKPGLMVTGIVIQTSDDKYLTFVGGDTDDITLASANDSEETYVFKVPGAGVKQIRVTFEDDDDPERVNERWENQRDRAGRTVGVGAAFTLTYGNSEVAAEIGQRAAGVTAGTLAVTASSTHEEENYATAGSDPFEGTSDDFKDFALDAAVSVNILDNNVHSGIAEGGKVRTTAAGEATEGKAKVDDPDKETPGEDEPEEIQKENGDLIVSATEVAKNEARASSFATGSSTAVGASVAVNVSMSDIAARLDSAAEAAGKAVVRSHSLSRDNTWSFASAMGADIQRNLNKLADKVDKAEKTAEGITTGSIFDKKKETKTTNTNARINNRLNNDDVRNGEGQKARNDLNVSANAMRTQKVQTENGDETIGGANDAAGFVNAEGDQTLDQYTAANKKSTLQVAAAVGVTVGLHKASATVKDVLTAAKDVAVTATNAGNFNTRATGAAMTLAKGKGKTIAAAVGVSVNKNEAAAQASGDLTAQDGSVNLASSLKQNMTDAYRGRLAVQSIAGSVSGKGSDASVAGAISILYSNGKSTAEAGGNLSGHDVTVSAYDKSKLAVRAGGINISKGTNVGMGISAATIWSGDEVRSEVKDGAVVTADSFTLKAVKAPVTWDDYKFPLGWEDLITDSSDLDDAERASKHKGLIDVHKDEETQAYKVKINLDTNAVMKLPDMLNFLSSKNYYTEAIAGSLVTGQASSGSANALNAAGSFSIVRALNKVSSILGNNVTVRRKGGDAGNTTILAQDDVTGRTLGGAAAAGGAKVGAGITVTFLYDEDQVTSKIGDQVNIDAGNNLSHQAVASTNVETYNVAASVNTSSQGSLSLGGGIDVILLKNTADAIVGSNAVLNAGGTMDVKADSGVNLLLVAASASVAKGAVAAGGTVAFAKNESQANVKIGASHSLQAAKDVNIAAKALEDVINVIVSASAAVSGKAAAAGAVNVLVDKSVGKVNLAGGGKGITSLGGSILLSGDAETRAVNATAAAAGGKNTAVGLSANVSVLQRESGVEVQGGEGYAMNAAGDVAVSSYGRDYSMALGLAVAASKDGLGLSGNLPVLVSRNKVKTLLGKVNVNAGGEAAVASRLDDKTLAVAGSVGLSLSSSAAAATAMFVNKANEVTTDLGTSSVTAGGSAGTLSQKLPKGAEPFKGLYVGAKVKDDLTAIAAGIALAGKHGITGNVMWAANENKVKTDTSRAALKAVRTGADGNAAGGGSATVEAKNDSDQLVLAGGLGGAMTVAAGATVAVVTSAKEVTALTGEAKAWQDVKVSADNQDTINEIAVSAGGSGKVAVELGIALQFLKSRVNAMAAGPVEAVKGSFHLTSGNDISLTNVDVALAGAGKVAVTPVFAMSAFTGESNAMLTGGSVKAGQGVKIAATSGKDMDQYTVGAAASGMAAVSGAVSVSTLKDTANALVQNGTNITAGSLDVLASSDYKQVGASAAIGASGKAAVAVNGMITIAKGNALAEMDGTADLTEKAHVKATSLRDMTNVAATVAAAGAVGVGVTVMGLVAGDKMDQDAADMLTYGNNSDKSKKTFDANELLTYMKGAGVKNTSDLEEKKDKNGNVTQTSLAEDLSGNGNRNASMKVGDENGNFDASSGMVDRGVYEGNSTAGENKQISDTGDIQRAKNLSNTSYRTDPTDSVVARIGENGSVSAAEVNVNADQETRAEVFGGTVAVGGGVAGVGASVSIAMLRSNVIAAMVGKVNAKNGAVNITASSRSGGVTAAEGSDEAGRTKAIADHIGETDESELKEGLADLKTALTKRSIRVLGVAAGFGNAGIAAAGSVARTDNITRALLGGSVEDAGALNVNALSDYGNVSALTLAVGGGSLGLSGAFSVALANGTVESRLNNNASISGNNTQISVTTDSVVNARTLSVTAAGGFVGGATGISVASNQLKQNTQVEVGASVNVQNGGAMTVRGRSSTKANSYLAGLSIGGGAVGLGAAVSIVKPILKTDVGVTGSRGNATYLNNLDSVKILNDVGSQANAYMLSFAAGGVAVQGNVLLVFNDTDATAKAGAVTGTLGSLKVNGDLDAAGRTRFASGTGGGISAGVSVSYVDVNSKNTAALDTTNFTAKVLGDLTVSTGENRDRKTLADAASVAAGAGALALSVNTSVARNRAQNVASITGAKGVNAGTVNLGSHVHGTTNAWLVGVSVSSVSIAASVLVAVNEATSKALMKVGGALNASLNAHSEVEGETNARLITGSGEIVGIKVNVANAYGRTNSVIDVEAAGGMEEGRTASIKADNLGKNKVTTNIDNLMTLSAISIAAMVGNAYSQDVYNARVKLNGGKYRASDVSVTTGYETEATATVTPSKSGVDASAVKIAVNYAGAKSTAYAGSELELADGAALTADGNVTVQTSGQTATTSHVKSSEFTINVVDVGVNTTRSEMSGTQAAVLRMNGGKIAGAKEVLVQSMTEKANAYAVVGSGAVSEERSKKKGFKLSLVGVDVNTATALENLASTAAILGSGKKTNTIAADSLILRADTLETESQTGPDQEKVRQKVETQALARTTKSTEVGLISGGGLQADAVSSDSFNAVMSGVNASLTGDATLESGTSTRANAEGCAPGSLSLLKVEVSKMYAMVGSEGDRQTSKVLIGDETTLNAKGALKIAAKNNGMAATDLEQGGAYSLIGIKTCKLPTASFYDTGVHIGKKAALSAGTTLDVLSESLAGGKSNVTSSGGSLAIDVNVTSGKNELSDENNLVISEGASLNAGGNLNVASRSSAGMNASTTVTGRGAIAGEKAKAENEVKRANRINVGDSARIVSRSGDVLLTVAAGEKDDIVTKAYAKSTGGIIIGKSTAAVKLDSSEEILVGKKVQISAGNHLNLLARNTSAGNGINTDASALTRGFGINPTAEATVELKFNTYVGINREQSGDSSLTQLNSSRGNVNVVADNGNMHARVNSKADGSAATGYSSAESVVNTYFANTIWVDNTNLYARENVRLLASNAGDAEKPRFDISSLAEMYALGHSNPLSELSGVDKAGKPFNQVRTNNARDVTTRGKAFIHIAENPVNGVDAYLKAQESNPSSGWSIKEKKESEVLAWSEKSFRCDFCVEGEGASVDAVAMAVAARNRDNGFAKALAPLTEIQRVLDQKGLYRSKAWYGEEEYKEASKRYDLNHPMLLREDMILKNPEVLESSMWLNGPTQLDTFLLPDSTRLYGWNREGSINLQFVAEVLRGDLLGTGTEQDIDVITALKDYAVNRPEIPIGSTGELNFAYGTLMLPEEADFELYLHEVSGNWLVRQFNSGFFRRLKADQTKINDFVLNTAKTPSTDILDGSTTSRLREGDETKGWEKYWLGDSPETAETEDQTLVYLLYNAETDEVDAYRTSRSRMARGENDIDVSLYIFRDSRSDRSEVENYNILFFDTPAGEKSLVKIVTDVLEDWELRLPRKFQVMLRGFVAAGADWPVYSLSDHLFVLFDGSDGELSLENGAYTAVFDGDSFDSPYLRIEGIQYYGIEDEDLRITIKKDHYIWPKLDEGYQFILLAQGQKAR